MCILMCILLMPVLLGRFVIYIICYDAVNVDLYNCKVEINYAL